MGDAVVPDEYGDLLARIAAEVRSTRLRVARTVASEVLALYWRIGQLILARQETEPWGSGVIRRLSMDPRRQPAESRHLRITTNSIGRRSPGRSACGRRLAAGLEPLARLRPLTCWTGIDLSMN